MCDQCYLTVCPASCPYSDGDAGHTPRRACALCGEPLFSGDEYFASEDSAICSSCADSATLDDLILLSGLDGVGELFDLLGFTRYS